MLQQLVKKYNISYTCKVHKIDHLHIHCAMYELDTYL